MSARLYFLIQLVVHLCLGQTWFNRTGNGYQLWCLGNCQNDAQTTVVSGVFLMGGSTDVDDAFKWLVANSGGGDIMVLRTSGAAAYNPYIYDLGKINSVTTILLTSRVASSDPFITERVRNSEGLFFAGGDQWTYYSQWKSTPLNDVFNYLINTKKITIGGTSAGMAIEGEFLYSAERGSVTSSTALRNPYADDITIGNQFLSIPNLKNVITDTHFYQRDRMGRLVTFIARLWADKLVSSVGYGIACNEQVAVLVDSKGIGTVVTQSPSSGQGNAYFLSTHASPARCTAGQPLVYDGIKVIKLGKGNTINLSTWESSNGVSYTLSASSGTLKSTGNGGSIY